MYFAVSGILFTFAEDIGALRLSLKDFYIHRKIPTQRNAGWGFIYLISSFNSTSNVSAILARVLMVGLPLIIPLNVPILTFIFSAVL